MAGIHPDLVVQVIQEMEETDNIRVHADLIEAAQVMNASKASENRSAREKVGSIELSLPRTDEGERAL